MKKALAVIAIAFIAAAIYVAWLHTGVTSTKWAIELVGGHENLEKTSPTDPEDYLFLQSLNHVPDINQSITTLLGSKCYTQDNICLDSNLAKANILSITGKNLSIAKK